MSTAVFATMGAAVLAWYLVSARAEKADISAAMAMVVVGVVVAHGPLAFVEVNVRSADLRHIAEATLAVVLFTDASRVNVTRLRSDMGLPVRLLAIGLPLTILAGAGAAAVLVSGLGVWVAATIGAIVAPTDAALGAPILVDERIPRRIRRALNVESGLNDGIATPFVNMFLAAAVAGGLGAGEGVGSVAWELVGGVGWGIGVGLGGAWLIRAAYRRGWTGPGAPVQAVLAVVVLVYAGALAVHANGFVAAFVAGLAFGSLADEAEEASLGLTEDLGQVLSLVVWFLFGAALVVPAVQAAVWGDVVFAVVALTVVRMVPVAAATLGAGLDRSTVALVGWFGPRGLASVVFTLIAVDALEVSQGDRVLAVGGLTVLLSVIAHGTTAGPFARRYAAHLGRGGGPQSESTTGPAAPRTRSLWRRHPSTA